METTWKKFSFFFSFKVICKQCNHCRDIDLCKDAFRDLAPVSGGPPVWLCASVSCKTPYDTADIEFQLMDALNRKTMGYALQVRIVTRIARDSKCVI